ncbi:MAG: hypothetical protein WBP35_06205 [Lactococcus chungangensis]
MERINFEKFEKIIIETDEKNPTTIATITENAVEPVDGYRIRIKPMVEN